LDVAQTSGSSDIITLLKMFRADMAQAALVTSSNRDRGKSRINQINGVDTTLICPELLLPGQQRKFLTETEIIAETQIFTVDEIQQQHRADFQLPKTQQFVYGTPPEC
jgi:hypothetical protein